MKKLTATLFIIASILISSTTLVEAKTTISPYGPTARCRDGSYSYAKNHRGACSHHKGVKVWYK